MGTQEENNNIEGQAAFQPRNTDDQSADVNSLSDLKPFRIEIAVAEEGRFFNIRPLGNGRYEIMDDEGSLGSIVLDSSDHARCESVGCELDMPLLHAIREGIQSHENWSNRA